MLKKNKIKKDGKIIGILFPFNTKKMNGPPYSIEHNELENKFSHKFNIIKKEFNNYSVKQRKNNEMFFEIIKK